MDKELIVLFIITTIMLLGMSAINTYKDVKMAELGYVQEKTHNDKIWVKDRNITKEIVKCQK